MTEVGDKKNSTEEKCEGCSKLFPSGMMLLDAEGVYLCAHCLGQLFAVQIQSLEIALKESIKLQSHYAKLLNMYDEGCRTVFENESQWIARLIEIEKLPPKKEKE
jgi:hypothetical protein